MLTVNIFFLLAKLVNFPENSLTRILTAKFEVICCCNANEMAKFATFTLSLSVQSELL